MTTLFTYSGAGSNTNPIGGPWSTIAGFNPLQRDANTVAGTVPSANNGAYVNSVSDQADCWMQGSLRGTIITSIAVMLRVATAAASGYLLQFYLGAPQIARFDAGSYTTLASDATTYADGDVIYFEAVGTVLTAKVNGSTILTYDTAPDGTKYASGRFGAYSFTDNTGLDTITAGDFGGGGSPIPYYAQMRRVH